MEPHDPAPYKARHAQRSSSRRRSRSRMPSASGYMAAAAAAAGALVFILLGVLQDVESPWVPAGLAACVVMLVAVGAREVVLRRAWARYTLDQDGHQERSQDSGERSSSKMLSVSGHASVLRLVQKESAKADATDSN